MEIPLALLADYANTSQDGKLNVMGVFNRILTKDFPTVHPEMRLVFRLEAQPSERGRQATVEIKLLDADASVLHHLKGRLGVPQESRQPTIEINHILRLTGMVFEKPGDYRFDILIDGDLKKQVPFTVEQLPPSK